MIRILLASLMLIGLGLPVQAAQKKKGDTQKILFLAGGKSHGPGKHEHNAGCILLADSLKKSGLKIESEVIAKWPEDLSTFDGVDAVVVFADAGGRYKEEQLQLLDEKVENGMGIMFIHYGVHPSKEVGQDYFTRWIGGYFETGYSVNPHWTASLSPKKGHPVGNGIDKPVIANDEFYFNMRYPKECDTCYPLVQSALKEERLTLYNNLWNELGDAKFGKDVTLMWCSDPKGKQGRGVGFSGGHFHRNWAINDFRKMALNAIVWIAGGDVPKNGVQSPDISEEQLNQNIDGVPKEPIKRISDEDILEMAPMLRPKDPANYNQRGHYDMIKKMKAASGK